MDLDRLLWFNSSKLYAYCSTHTALSLVLQLDAVVLFSFDRDPCPFRPDPVTQLLPDNCFLCWCRVRSQTTCRCSHKRPCTRPEDFAVFVNLPAQPKAFVLPSILEITLRLLPRSIPDLDSHNRLPDTLPNNADHFRSIRLNLLLQDRHASFQFFLTQARTIAGRS